MGCAFRVQGFGFTTDLPSVLDAVDCAARFLAADARCALQGLITDLTEPASGSSFHLAGGKDIMGLLRRHLGNGGIGITVIPEPSLHADGDHEWNALGRSGTLELVPVASGSFRFAIAGCPVAF